MSLIAMIISGLSGAPSRTRKLQPNRHNLLKIIFKLKTLYYLMYHIWQKSSAKYHLLLTMNLLASLLPPHPRSPNRCETLSPSSQVFTNIHILEPVEMLKIIIAGFMMLYGGFFTFRTTMPKIERPTPIIECIVGFFGGLLGGAASLSGALPTMR